MKEFVPMLFSSMKEYNGKKFLSDVIAGIIVAIIALPLSIALALASGVGPEQGLYTAIVAGFLISFFGGSKVQIAGPTAAFATIVAGIVATKGMEGLVIATILAGILLIVMGFCKFGSLIKFIPYTITTGFTAGIAVTILIGQFKDFFGITYLNGEAPIETVEKLEAFFANISTLNIDALIVGAICLAILFLFPKLTQKIPSSLIAVIAGILMVQFLPLNVNTIGDLYEINSGLPKLTIPSFSFSDVKELLPDAVTIAILAGIESLLSCVVADGMINSRHRSNMELVAQGIGNIGSSLFGGIPATGAIARTAANIKNGGNTPIAGIIHSLVLVLVLVVLMPYASLIPMPAIAAILIHVAYNMSQIKPFAKLLKNAPKSDITVLLVTFLLTVVFDLVVAIEFGLIIAAALFIKRMSDETTVESWKYDDENENLRQLDKAIRVYELNGPLFFAVTEQLNYITVKDYTKCVILRMRSVNSLDATAVETLEGIIENFKKQGITVVLSHVNKQPMNVMVKSEFVAKIGKENICSSIDDAIERANIIINS